MSGEWAEAGIKGIEAAKKPELERINSWLTELNETAASINGRLISFNNRVQGALPVNNEKAMERVEPDSTLNAIRETMDFLGNSLGAISDEVDRIENIG